MKNISFDTWLNIAGFVSLLALSLWKKFTNKKETKEFIGKIQESVEEVKSTAIAVKNTAAENRDNTREIKNTIDEVKAALPAKKG